MGPTITLQRLIIYTLTPPTTILFLTLFLPPYYLLKSLHSTATSLLRRRTSLHGKVALVTGASSGIGEHVAYEYARRGARLALVARRGLRLGAVATSARQLGSPDVIIVPADVASLQDNRRFISRCISHFGRLDHVVVNAGITPVFMLEDATDVKNLAPAMETNFWGAVYSTHTALPHLVATKGRIVAVASSAAWLTSPRLGIYSASKAAMLSFFRALRIELRGRVGVTIVTPGLTESQVTAGKFFTGEGKMTVDQDLRDVQVNLVPIQPVEKCARAIVESACNGDENLTMPSWMKQTLIWKEFFPEILDWLNRLFVVNGLGKKIVDFLGAKKLLYPCSIRSQNVEVD